MQGGCFSISNLGGNGGTYFTPIVHAPEVAILGISRGRVQPVYKDGQFIPRQMLPLSLSYRSPRDRRADGMRFLRGTRMRRQPFLARLAADDVRSTVVVGGGPVYAAAFLAADLGLSVTLVDLKPIPRRVRLSRLYSVQALLHVAQVIDESRQAKAWASCSPSRKIDSREVCASSRAALSSG